MAKKNAGKLFEKDLENSCPTYVFMHRVRDLIYMAGSSSICDYIVYKHPNLFLFELKSHKGVSIPIKEEFKTKNGVTELKRYGVITVKQLEGLFEESKKKGVHAGFIFNFREKFSTYYVPVENVYAFIKSPDRDRNSISMEWCEENGIRIPQTKIRTRWSYDFRFLDLIGGEEK